MNRRNDETGHISGAIEQAIWILLLLIVIVVLLRIAGVTW